MQRLLVILFLACCLELKLVATHYITIPIIANGRLWPYDVSKMAFQDNTEMRIMLVQPPPDFFYTGHGHVPEMPRYYPMHNNRKTESGQEVVIEPKTDIQREFSESGFQVAEEDGLQETLPPSGQETGKDGQSGCDHSYTYSYRTDSSTKTESSDKDGNVEGTYTYLDGSGKMQTVSYTSKVGEGFVVKGDTRSDEHQKKVPVHSEHDIQREVTFENGQEVEESGSESVESGLETKGVKNTKHDRKIRVEKKGWEKFPLGNGK